MVSIGEANQPHAVCIPVPAQGHIKAMLQLSKLLHHKGFRITYVNTEFNHRRFVKSLAPDSLDGLPDDFQFETIPDGLPDRDDDSTQDFNLLADSVKNNFLAPFLDLIKKLNRSTPPVTLIVSDGFMHFTTTAAQQLGIPITLFFTFSASSSMGYMKYPALVERGLAPLKDESSFTNGFLDQIIDWIPGIKLIRLRDLPNNFVTTNPNDKIFNNILEVMSRVHEASAIIVHTFDALEQDVLDALSSMYPPVYALQLLFVPAIKKEMEITNVSEYEAIAKEKLPKMVYDYYASGAEDEWTLKENERAFSRILFRPRILVDVSKIDLRTTVLGFNISMPIMIAPTAMQKMAHPEGEFATARAASAADTIMTLSSWSTSSVEEVASTGPGIRFFQLYVYKDRNMVAQLVKRAERAGFKAIVLTVDTPRLGRREADIKNRFVLPPNLTLKNFEDLDLGKMDKTNDSGLASYVAGQTDQSLSWKDIQWLQTITKLPILVKGVITAEDARLAIQYGAAGIIVSNHGARQLDYLPATIMALEEVVKAAQGQIPVFMDGGVRRGTDVFKALALGASGVFIGRPVVFSLAADGEAGVRKVLQMLRDEFELTMALSGCRSLKEITRNHIVTEWDRPRVAPRL